MKLVTTSMSLPSKGGLKNGKHGPNDRASNVGKAASQVRNFAVRVTGKCPFLIVFFCYQRGVPARASVTMMSSQDSLQSQALFNIKDSNKVGHHRVPQYRNLQSFALDSYICIFI